VVHFHYGPSVHLPQLPTPPRGDAVEVVFRREQPNSTGETLTRVPANFTGATLDFAWSIRIHAWWREAPAKAWHLNHFTPKPEDLYGVKTA
jgi:hypothetical protein